MNENLNPGGAPPNEARINMLAMGPLEQADAPVALSIQDAVHRAARALHGTLLHERASDDSKHLLEAFVSCIVARHQCIPRQEGSAVLVFRPRNFLVIDYVGRIDCTLTVSLWGREEIYRQADLASVLAAPRPGYTRIRATSFVNLPLLLHAADIAWQAWDGRDIQL